MKDTISKNYAPDFELPGVDYEVHHLARYLEKYRAVAVVFMSNQSSGVHLDLDRLKQLQHKCATLGATLIGINPNDAIASPVDSMENMKEFAACQALNFPYIRDVTQDVARCFDATTTPEVFLLDQQGIIRYRGQIDYHPNFPDGVRIFYLEQAMMQLLNNEPVEPTATKPIGDLIHWRPSDAL